MPNAFPKQWRPPSATIITEDYINSVLRIH
jgi:hypothetical protein